MGRGRAGGPGGGRPAETMPTLSLTVPLARRAGIRRIRAAGLPLWWKVLRVAAALALVTAIAGGIAYNHFTDPDRLRSTLLAALGDIFRSRVDLDSAQFSFAQGLTVRGLRVYALPQAVVEGGAPVGAVGKDDLLINVPELVIEPDYARTLRRLVELDPGLELHQIRVNRPELLVRVDRNGNLRDENIIAERGDEPDDDGLPAIPPIRVSDATIAWEGTQIFAPGTRHRMESVTLALQRLAGGDGRLSIVGNARGEPWGEIAVDGRIDLGDGSGRIAVTNRAVRLDSGYVARLAPDIRNALGEFTAVAPGVLDDDATVGVVVDVQVRLIFSPDRPVGLLVQVDALGGVIAYEEFPAPVEVVVGAIQLTNYPPEELRARAGPGDRLVTVGPADDPAVIDRVEWRDPGDVPPDAEPARDGRLWAHIAVRGRYGLGGRVTLTGEIADIGSVAGERISLLLEAEDVFVDPQFRRAIAARPEAESVAEVFQLFDPHGVASARFEISGSRHQLQVRFIDNDGLFDAFPLPVFRVNGDLVGWGDAWRVPAANALSRVGGGEITVTLPTPELSPARKPVWTVEVDARNLEITPTLLDALPEVIREPLGLFDLGGTLDVRQATIVAAPGDGDADDGGVSVRLTLSPRRLRVVPEFLPLPITLTAGEIDVVDGAVTLRDLVGTWRGATITASGTITPGPDGPMPDIRLELGATNLPVDAAFWRRLRAPTDNPVAQQLRDALLTVPDQFAFEGLIDVAHRFDSTSTMPHRVEVTIHNGSAAYAPYPLPLHSLRGRISATVGESAVAIYVHHVDGRYTPTGGPSGRGTAAAGDTGSPDVHPATVALSGTVLLPVARKSTRLTALTGGFAASPIGGDGAGPGSAGRTAAVVHRALVETPAPVITMNLSVRDLRIGTDPAVSDMLRRLQSQAGMAGGGGRSAPDDAAEPVPTLIEMFAARGTVDADVILAPGAASGSMALQGATIRLRGVNVRPEMFPYAVDDLRGEVIWDGGRAHVGTLTGRRGAATITVTGGGFIPGVGYDLNVVMRNARFDAELRDALPEAPAAILDTLQPQGRFSVAATFAARDLPAAASGPDADPALPAQRLTTYLELRLHDNSANLGLAVEHARGSIIVRGIADPTGVKMHGKAVIDEAQWADTKVHGLRVDLQFADGELQLQNIYGTAYGGHIAGRMTMQAEPGGTYDGYLQLRRLDIGRYLREVFPGSARLVGIADAELWLAGRLPDATADDPGRFGGRGRFDILDASIFDVPLVLKIFDFTNYARPTAIDEVRAEFTLEPDFLRFTRFDMVSDAVGIYSDSGTITYSAQMNMNFFVDLQPRARLGPLREPIRFIERALVPIFVSGPLTDPRISAVFPGEEDDD
jgi:hypothetical protein